MKKNSKTETVAGMVRGASNMGKVMMRGETRLIKERKMQTKGQKRKNQMGARRAWMRREIPQCRS